MSLIEQAAKRLEELRRAGAEISEAQPRTPLHAAETAPTPEAFVRALDTRIPHEVTPRPTIHDEPRRAPVSRAEHPGRVIDIDFATLKQRGFVTPDAPKSQIADEFRVLKRPIIRNAVGQGGVRVRNGNLVMVTSALPGEGKTFTSLNLALSIAMEVDSRVLLVDGDVAHPAIPSILGSPHGPGLLDLLTRDDLDFADALVKTKIDKLALLPAGSRHRRATELLASEQMASLLRELASRYADRIVIFDSPPLLPTTEARVLATHMGQIVMVVAADATSHHAVTQALATIETCDVVLMALNKARQTEVGTYYGYYRDDDAA
ncbi:MAG TPA: XrtA-associated tyrosine autokinase [Casimicrobiaceae bacterium]|nr:XrtA-associated tyrosine autokinase [Casimicrobiaceae bacterium]